MDILHGIRGAIVVPENTREAILTSTRELLRAVIKANELTKDTVAGIFFTSTVDLNADFPAYAVRDMGWDRVPSLCAQELAVPDSMKRVIRTMVFVNRPASFRARHQYIGDAAKLRPDLAGDQP